MLYLFARDISLILCVVYGRVLCFAQVRPQPQVACQWFPAHEPQYEPQRTGMGGMGQGEEVTGQRAGWGGGQVKAEKVAATPPIFYIPSWLWSIYLGPLRLALVKLLVQVWVDPTRLGGHMARQGKIVSLSKAKPYDPELWWCMNSDAMPALMGRISIGLGCKSRNPPSRCARKCEAQ